MLQQNLTAEILLYSGGLSLLLLLVVVVVVVVVVVWPGGGDGDRSFVLPPTDSVLPSAD